ncbi:hypothetical protein NP493_281g00049 [Ridgeia piscesae]|uniref:Reticulocalbin-3 n=1 Tax=Ridgeia piscesae TaxID=27915 RepID=A0AAD9NX63_RIDPI|nr:hypothetical protein NP493_281g00049 [Ridgeia piscesae]
MAGGSLAGEVASRRIVDQADDVTVKDDNAMASCYLCGDNDVSRVTAGQRAHDPYMLRLTAMESVATFLLLALVAATLSSAIPKHDDNKRVIDKELSDEKHYAEGEEHNPEYDHEAFLGKETAKTFDELTPEESKKRLGLIYDKIDKDGDGFVTEEELQKWVTHVQNRYIMTDTEKQWKEHELEGDTLTWTTYKTKTYGDHEEEEEAEGGYDYKNMISRDERRWKKADLNGDGNLSKEEFASFLHPEDVEHMRDTVIMETLDDIDKDKDGFISLEEYIDDIQDDEDDDENSEDEDEDREEFKHNLDKNGDGKLDKEEIKAWIIPDDYNHVEEESRHLIREADANQVCDMWSKTDESDTEPDWVKTEREQFTSLRDKNGDGKMDQAEVRDWIIPPDYDHSDAEAKHLIQESDKDGDKKLTKEEVLDKYDLFVGSQATDFGEALARHDEF